jgi:type IV pilus assembly protein PilC
MNTFKYIARDTDGQRVEGTRQGDSPNEVLGWLREHGLTAVGVDVLPAGGDAAPRRVRGRKRRIKSSDLAAVCWQLTTMLEGGVPIATAVGTIADDIENLRLRDVLRQIQEKMEKGEPFSEGIAKFPRVFNNLCCAIAVAGETGGNLPRALRRLAEYFDGRDNLARKVKGAVAYPAFIFGFVVLIVVFIMTFIIPRFRLIFDQFGSRLPAFTRGFMAVYDMICHNLHLGIAVLLLTIALAAAAYYKTARGHYFFSRFALGLPLLGKIFSQAFVALFCRTTSTLLASGVSVLEVFDILATMTKNDVIKTAVLSTRNNIVEGANISLSLSSSGFFPNMVVKMVQVGEESGSLPSLLDRTGDYYERKVDSTISTVMGLLEPAMIVTVGAIVLVIVLALYLPIFSISGVGK